MKKNRHRQAVSALGEEIGRELGARTILFHQAVAERLGLSLIEHKCLDYIARPGRTQLVTAGELAEITGLTTGAITGVINRLVRAGYVRREKNPGDRRQVWIVPIPARLSRIYPMFAGLQRGLAKLCASYSEAELALIRRFLEQGAALLEREARRLRIKRRT